MSRSPALVYEPHRLQVLHTHIHTNTHIHTHTHSSITGAHTHSLAAALQVQKHVLMTHDVCGHMLMGETLSLLNLPLGRDRDSYNEAEGVVR